MKESFLHYVWQTRQFDFSELTTTNGERLLIPSSGYPHQDGGPDFVNARVTIGKTTWAGNVEIHLNSSDWYKHNHHLDPAYDNTILHVVYHHDREVLRTDGTPIPCLEIGTRINSKLIDRYETMLSGMNSIPCRAFIDQVPTEIKTICLESMAIERLRSKTKPILERLALLKNDWEEVFYQEICAALGLRVNKQPFLQLAKNLPYTLLMRHKNNLLQLEALLFGVAGFLRSNSPDSYERSLSKEFRFLKTKYSLEPIDEHLWKFLRLRPANFPTVRLAQLAKLIHTKEHLFSMVKNHPEAETIRTIFNVSTSDYWSNHHLFGRKSKPRTKSLGSSTIDLITINAIAPVLFCYAHETENTTLQDQVFRLLESLPPENNRIVQRYNSYNFPVKNALNSQAVLQLSNGFCNFKACLQCAVGHAALKMCNS